jgi:hypothetical protein
MVLLAALLLSAEWAAIALSFTCAGINFGTSALFATVSVWPVAIACVLLHERRDDRT